MKLDSAQYDNFVRTQTSLKLEKPRFLTVQPECIIETISSPPTHYAGGRTGICEDTFRERYRTITANSTHHGLANILFLLACG
jgi:hypothetical protein